MGEIDPMGDLDFFTFEGQLGSVLEVEVVAARVGSDIDLAAELYDSSGYRVIVGDDTYETDPAFQLTLDWPSQYYLKIRGFSSSSHGWYFADVKLDGVALVPEANSCSELEVGGDFFSGQGQAITLVPAGDGAARPFIDTCISGCSEDLELPDGTLGWLIAYCAGGSPPHCGDGQVDTNEECDDNNRDGGDGCSPSCILETDGVLPFSALRGLDPALGHGTRAGAGFRQEALPIIVHTTDARSHNETDYRNAYPDIGANDTADTFYELEKLGARIIGISTATMHGSPIGDLETPPGMAFRSGALVPPCAFDGTAARLSGRCGAQECCVGINGQGQSPPEGTDGLCTLSFEMDAEGRGLTDGIIAGINALAEFATYRIYPLITSDAASSVDATCFVQAVEIHEVNPSNSCAPELAFADRDDDGYQDTVLNVTPRSRVTYDFWVENRDSRDRDGDLDAFEPCGPPGTYSLLVEIIGDDVTVLSRQELRITVLP